MSDPGYADRLHAAATATREHLERSSAERWEIFAKASSAREVEVTASLPLRIIDVEETGVAVRGVRNGKTGFAAASGLESDASRRAVEGALATEATVAVDPLPPPRLLGTAEVRPARPLPPRGWATHAGEELARAVSSVNGGPLAPSSGSLPSTPANCASFPIITSTWGASLRFTALALSRPPASFHKEGR